MESKWQTCDKCYGSGYYYVTHNGSIVTSHSKKAYHKVKDKTKCEVCKGAGAYRKESDG